MRAGQKNRIWTTRTKSISSNLIRGSRHSINTPALVAPVIVDSSRED